MDWKFADVWEAIAVVQPEMPAVIQGDRVILWRELDQRADALAAYFLEQGLGRQSKVATYLYNGPEYIESHFAAFKAGLSPVNANYRYGWTELTYLFENADVEAVVFHASFAAVAAEVRDRLPGIRFWIAVAEPGHPVPDWAVDYDTVLARVPATRPVVADWGRSGDDLILLYTGGTTGMPKGVMWRQSVLIEGWRWSPLAHDAAQPASIEELLAIHRDPGYVKPVTLVACPLMHGTGQNNSYGTLSSSGTVVLLSGRKFDAAELLDEVDRLGVTRAVIVGQAFAEPILDALEKNPGRWDLSSLKTISSSGTVWSQENKRGMLRHARAAKIVDSLASSESFSIAYSISHPGEEAPTASFVISPGCILIDENDQELAPVPGARGLVAVNPFLPEGYYKDEKKTADTFRTIGDLRWSIPGDWGEINPDGSLKFLGRGSVCINTGGEKVFPEEVEEVLKQHPSVRDAVVVGLPEPRFGEVICAVVEPAEGAAPVLSELSEQVRGTLAAYKAPRKLVVVDSINRGPSGKVDYKMIKRRAQEALSVSQA